MKDIILLVLVGCQIILSMPQGTFQISELKEGQAYFSRQLLQLLESSSESNFVFSPHSMHSAFTQLLHGAGGRSQEELESLLGVKASQSLTSQYQRLTEALENGNATVREANLLAVARGFKPKLGYIGNLQTGFNSDLREFDFGTDSFNSVRQINNFVAEKTNEKIKDLLAENDIDGLTRLVLVNALYFKDSWQYEFDPETTFNHTFKSSLGDITTEFMNRDAEVRVLEVKDKGSNPILDILELPYSDSDKAMLIVLPKEGVSTDNIGDLMQDINLDDVRNFGKLSETGIFIPKFKLRYQTYLKEKMTQLGAGEIFSNSANLTGISDEELKVTSGVHQAFIEVNEEGTEAAAATALVVGLRTARTKRQFFADRPFLFFVYDFVHGVPLFAGKVVDPSSDTIIERKASFTQEDVPLSGDPAVCAKMFRDFPNARDNKMICEKVERERKRLDWLRNNRALCEESSDFFDNFMNNSCQALWCEEAVFHINNWRQEAGSSRCDLSEGKVETQETRKACKNVKNKLKAYNFLQCRIA